MKINLNIPKLTEKFAHDAPLYKVIKAGIHGTDRSRNDARFTDLATSIFVYQSSEKMRLKIGRSLSQKKQGNLLRKSDNLPTYLTKVII